MSRQSKQIYKALTKLSVKVIGFIVHRQYNIPKQTSRHHFKRLNNNVKFGRPKGMTENMGKELVAHNLNLESSFYGLAAIDLRKLTYQMAKKY